jgi:transporter family-2 protein
MKNQSINLSLALAGGITLASMLAINSELAAFSSPLLASWLAHGVGAVISFFLLLLVSALIGKKVSLLPKSGTPIWAYLGGVPGALTVILAAITVNSPLGLSGSIVLIMAGQLLFGLISDTLGLFGLPKRSININDGFALLFLISGCLITMFGRG